MAEKRRYRVTRDGWAYGTLYEKGGRTEPLTAEQAAYPPGFMVTEAEYQALEKAKKTPSRRAPKASEDKGAAKGDGE